MKKIVKDLMVVIDFIAAVQLMVGLAMAEPSAYESLTSVDTLTQYVSQIEEEESDEIREKAERGITIQASEYFIALDI